MDTTTNKISRTSRNNLCVEIQITTLKGLEKAEARKKSGN